MFRLPSAIDPTALVAALRKQSLFADCRGHILRLSPGNLTTADGVAKLLRALRAEL
jgi:hypothetical protein